MVRWDSDFLLAGWTIHEGELYPWCGPSDFDSFDYAAHMEYMATAKHDRWLVSQSTDVAQSTQVICCEAIVELLAWVADLVVSFNAVRFQTWKTLSLLVISFAFVSAFVRLVATISHVLHTFISATHILEGRVITERRLLQNLKAEPTLLGNFLVGRLLT